MGKLCTPTNTGTHGFSDLPTALRFSDAGTGRGARGATGPPIFDISVNPIPTTGGRFCPPFTSGTSNVFHLPASLRLVSLTCINQFLEGIPTFQLSCPKSKHTTQEFSFVVFTNKKMVRILNLILLIFVAVTLAQIDDDFYCK